MFYFSEPESLTAEVQLQESRSEEDDLVDAERFRRLPTGNTTDPFAPVRAERAASNVSKPDLLQEKYTFTGAGLAGAIGAGVVGAYLWNKGWGRWR